WGMLATDLRYELLRTHIGDMRTLTAERLRQLFAELESEARARIGEAGKAEVRIDRALDMRYGEQIFEITVPLDDGDLDHADVLDRTVERFHRRHEALYTYSSPEREVVLVNARLTGVGLLPDRPKESVLPERRPAPPRTHRRIFRGGWLEVPVF